MEAVKVYIGQAVVMSNGAQQDSRRAVQFEGEKLGQYREYGQGRDGGPTDTRGTIETLYRVSDGRLVVHTEDWSHWQGEPNTEALQEVTEADLQPGGGFEDLGAACGFGRPLTLEEALSRGGGEDSDAAQEMARNAAQIVRNMGNQAGRGRLNRDLSGAKVYRLGDHEGAENDA